MPRGRIRQTPEGAWRDSEGRILKCLRGHREGKGFNQIQKETGLSTTTVAAHLKLLVSKNKVFRDPRDGLYRLTAGGGEWLDIQAVIQRVLDLAPRAGAVGPAAQRRPGSLASRVYAMPSRGPGALNRMANDVPPLVQEILLADLVQRGLVPKAKGLESFDPEGVRALVQGLPALVLLELDWRGWSEEQDTPAAREAWRRAMHRAEPGIDQAWSK